MSCDRAREVFSTNLIAIKEVVDARKVALNEDSVWTAMKTAAKIFVVKGKSVIALSPKNDKRADILATVLGRSGTLRAPTLRKGRIWYVGYNQEMYDNLVG